MPLAINAACTVSLFKVLNVIKRSLIPPKKKFGLSFLTDNYIRHFRHVDKTCQIRLTTHNINVNSKINYIGNSHIFKFDIFKRYIRL